MFSIALSPISVYSLCLCTAPDYTYPQFYYLTTFAAHEKVDIPMKNTLTQIHLLWSLKTTMGVRSGSLAAVNFDYV